MQSSWELPSICKTSVCISLWKPYMLSDHRASVADNHVEGFKSNSCSCIIIAQYLFKLLYSALLQSSFFAMYKLNHLFLCSNQYMYFCLHALYIIVPKIERSSVHLHINSLHKLCTIIEHNGRHYNMFKYFPAKICFNFLLQKLQLVAHNILYIAFWTLSDMK